MTVDLLGGQCLTIARRLRAAGARVIGLVPLGRVFDLAPATAAMASALSVLTGERVAVLDAWPRWAPSPDVPAGLPWVRAQAGPVSMLSLAPEPDALAAMRLVADTAGWARDRFAHVLVDLTGLPVGRGNALATVDTLVPLAAVGKVTDRELTAHALALPADRTLGVVLVG